MTNVNYKELKKNGFMQQIQTDNFSMRLKSVGGHLTAAQLQTIQEVAEKYGNGTVHLTSRQGVEIPFIKLADIETVIDYLHKNDMEVGACGPRVRTITACHGNSICRCGLINTAEVAKELDVRYGGKELPHKFKMGVTGCPNNCLKAEQNDIGIKGALKPLWLEDKCCFCGLCAATCPGKAITVDKSAKTLTLDEEKCINCGKCNKVCPTSAWTGQQGFLLSFGGLYGNRITIGKHLLPIILSQEILYKAVDTTLNFFAKNANKGERFANTLNRVGWEKLEKILQQIL